MLAPKAKCIGCSACQQICQFSCIEMISANDGFLYPEVNTRKCIGCGLCEKICPVINATTGSISPKKALGGFIIDEQTRLLSSSGGIFPALAKETLKNNGVVFGAKYGDENQVVHGFCETVKELSAFQGSKYVQSKIGNSFKKAKEFLDCGREVLFTGTPCQILGLKSFLNKNYDNLKTIDIICHGAPSPMVFEKYSKSLHKEVESINFRDKADGWQQYNVLTTFKDGTTYSENHSDNSYMQLFLENMISRESCSNCPAKSSKSGSDITLGDLWGYEKLAKNVDYQKGLSLVIANTEKGMQLIESLSSATFFEIDYKAAVRHNPSLVYSSPANINRDFFFRILNLLGYKIAYAVSASNSTYCRIVRRLYRIFTK